MEKFLVRKMDDILCDVVESKSCPKAAKIVNDLLKLVGKNLNQLSPDVVIANDHIFKVLLGSPFPEFWLAEYLPQMPKPEWTPEKVRERREDLENYRNRSTYELVFDGPFLPERENWCRNVLEGIFLVVRQSNYYVGQRSEFYKDNLRNSVLRVGSAEEVISALLLFIEERVEKEMSVPRSIEADMGKLKQLLLSNS